MVDAGMSPLLRDLCPKVAPIEARIAALENDERDLLEKAAVFGNVFWVSAVIAMTRANTWARGRNSSVDLPGVIIEPRPARTAAASARKFECVRTTPLGRPVVPEV